MCYLLGFLGHGSRWIIAAAAIAFLVLITRSKRRPRPLRVVFVLGLCALAYWWLGDGGKRHAQVNVHFPQHWHDEVREVVDQQQERVHRAVRDTFRAEKGRTRRGAETPAGITLELRLRTDELEEHHVDAAQLAAAVWTLLDLSTAPGDPVDLRRLEQIEVLRSGDEQVTLRDVARLSRRTTKPRSPREPAGRLLALNLGVDDEDSPFNVEEVALELESREMEKAPAERAVTHIDAGQHSLAALIMVDRLPHLASLPPAPPSADVPPPEAPEAPPAAPLAAAPAPPAEAAPPAPGSGAAEQIEARAEAIAAAAESVAETITAAAERAAERAEAAAERAAERAEQHAERIADAAESLETPQQPAPPIAAGAPETPVASAPPADASPPARRREPTTLRILDERPDWIETLPQNEHEYAMTEVGGPFATRRECELALSDMFQRLAEDYAQLYLGQPVRLDHEQLYHSGICREAYFGPKDTSLGKMLEVHALAVFDDQARQVLREARRAAIVRGRLEDTAGAVALIVGLLGTLFGYLKLDTATRGYYTGRLRLAAGTLAFGLLALVISVMKW